MTFANVDRLLDGAGVTLDLASLLRVLDDFEAVLAAVLDVGLRLVPSEAGSILLLTHTGEDDELYFKEAAGPKAKDVTRYRLRPGEGVAGWVARSGEPASVSDVLKDLRHSSRIAGAVGHEARNILCVPLRSGDAIFGAMELVNKRAGSFTQDDLVLLSALSERAAAVIDKARLQKQKDLSFESLRRAQASLSRKIEELGVLYEIERKVNSTLPLDHILDIVTEVTVSALQAEAGSIYVLTEGTDTLLFQTARGVKAAEVSKIVLKPGEGFAGWVVKHREPLVINGDDAIASDARHRKDIADSLRFPIHSMICVPLLRGDRCLGAFQVMNKVRIDFTFDAGDQALLQMIASQAAKLIEAHLLYQESARQEHLAALGRFVSSVLHDIRSPLTTIAGFAEILGQDVEIPLEERKRYLDFVLEDVAAIRSMADEILEFSKGSQTVARQEIHVPTFLEDFKQLVDRRLEGRPIEVTVAAALGVGSVAFDPRKIERAFLNLATNAADAMEGGGKLHISASDDDGAVAFSFKDTGPGIAADVRDTLFEPFVSSGKDSHAGLGLSIVRQIIQAHGGTVSVASPPGEGSEFTVRIPRI